MYYYPTVSKVQVKIPTNGGLNLPGSFSGDIEQNILQVYIHNGIHQ